MARCGRYHLARYEGKRPGYNRGEAYVTIVPPPTREFERSVKRDPVSKVKASSCTPWCFAPPAERVERFRMTAVIPADRVEHTKGHGAIELPRLGEGIEFDAAASDHV